MSANPSIISIESANAPLAYRASGKVGLVAPDLAYPQIGFRIAARALKGMQKEALIAQSGNETIWRMVCDEGPYLNGTDLAPPPLAFFSAGMASSIAAGILSCAKDQDARIEDLTIVQDNIYTMEGSAIRGTMTAGALPVELSVSARVSGGDRSLNSLVFEAVAKSPVDALMRNELVDTFSITRNGRAVTPAIVVASTNPVPGDPSKHFAELCYIADKQTSLDRLSKLHATESVFDADHGVGAAMRDDQKRQLQIRSKLTVRDDGLRSIDVQILKPIGSTFRFLSDDSPGCGGAGRAPSGLAYVSAGIGFCFMTQLGRYAGIAKKNLNSYGVVQDTVFDLDEGRTYPVDTHSYIETDEDEETTRRIVDMAEQTCFLHGACRMSNMTRISISST